MMPGYPVSHLIVRQTGFSFGSPEAFFDAMSCRGYAGQFRQGDIGGCIRQIIINLVCIIRLTFASYKQYFVRSCATRVGPRLDPTLHRFDHQRSLFPIPHIDLDPSVFGQHRAPLIHSHERILGMPTSSRVLCGCLDVTDQRVRRDRKQITFAKSTQIQPKSTGTTHLIVARDPAVRQNLSASFNISNAS